MTLEIPSLSSHIRRQLVHALRSGELAPPYSRVALLSAVLHAPQPEELVAWLNRRAVAGVSPAGLAFGLECWQAGADSMPRPSLVWTGPQVMGVQAQGTRAVYESLFRQARSSIWISTFAFFDGPKAFEVLAAQMDECPDLRVKLLLNIQRKYDDTTDPRILTSRFRERFWQREWPGQRRPEVFFDPRSLDSDGPGGVLHAKGVVVDESKAFITSANLTEAAWDRNVELGVLIHDRPFAKAVIQHFHRLIEQKKLEPL